LVIVVVVIPIMVMMPPVIVCIPPQLVLSPTALSYLLQFMAPVIRLGAVVSMVFNSLMELVIGPCRAPPAIVVIRRRTGHGGQEDCRSQYDSGQQILSEKYDVRVIR
jgi:hypothetical protein